MHSASEGRKIDIIKQISHVSFEMEYFSETVSGEIACKWGTKYRSVMGTGTITIVTDTELKKSGLDLLMKKYGDLTGPDYDAAALDKVVLLKLKIESNKQRQPCFCNKRHSRSKHGSAQPQIIDW